MIALWYTDGELEPAPFQDGRRHIRRHGPMRLDVAMSFDDPAPVKMLSAPVWTEVAHRLVRDEVAQPDDWRRLSRRERRGLARSGSAPGRRRTLSVPRGWWVPRPPLPRVDALLYLPDGESVTQRHLDDVERWILEKGKVDG